MSDNLGWNVAISRQDLEIGRIHLAVTQLLYEQYDSKVDFKYFRLIVPLKFSKKVFLNF